MWTGDRCGLAIREDEFGKGAGAKEAGIRGAGIRWDGPKRDGSRWGVDERTCKIRAAHMDDADHLGVANGT